ncbi:hypothetical protein Bca4012_008236 [Brassica carinata]
MTHSGPLKVSESQRSGYGLVKQTETKIRMKQVKKNQSHTKQLSSPIISPFYFPSKFPKRDREKAFLRVKQITSIKLR